MKRHALTEGWARAALKELVAIIYRASFAVGDRGTEHRGHPKLWAIDTVGRSPNRDITPADVRRVHPSARTSIILFA